MEYPLKDLDDVLELINELRIRYLNHYGLDDYLENVVVCEKFEKDDDGSTIVTCYSNKLKAILVNMAAMEYLINTDYSDSLRDFLNPLELDLYRKLEIAKMIIRELYEALVWKNKDNENTLESKIMQLSLGDINDDIIKVMSDMGLSEFEIKSYHLKTVKLRALQVYSQKGDYAPFDRVAHLNVLEDVLNSLDHFKDKLSGLYRLEKREKRQVLLNGYKKYGENITSPTLPYISLVWGQYGLESLDWYHHNYVKCLNNVKRSVSFDERIKLGLPIDKSEYLRTRIRRL